MRPGQPADLFHMFPGEKGERLPIHRTTLKKKKKKKRKDKDSWQVLGFRDPLHECRENSHLRLHRIHHSRDFMVVELFYIANKLPYYNLCKLVFSTEKIGPPSTAVCYNGIITLLTSPVIFYTVGSYEVTRLL